jgi:L-alanine-DL-glutamate epimerase-like enolase superfamily enzyme
MKITEVNVFAVRIPYISRYVTSQNVTPAGRHVIVKISTDAGIDGWGETGIISQRFPLEGATLEGMYMVLKSHLGPAIIGMNPLEIDRIMEKLEDTVRANYFAKSAIDHAVYDIAGKALNVPVYTLLGGCYRTEFGVSRSLPIDEPEKVAETAKRLKDRGYVLLTAKIGIDWKKDVKIVEAVRKGVGESFPLEVDANAGYDAPTAMKALRAMEEFEIEAAEQPVAGWDLDGMAELAASFDFPIVADESVFTVRDAMRVVQKRAADVICLKPIKSGGMYFCKKIQRIAEAGDLLVSTGSMHPFGIGTAAIHQFVASLKSVNAVGYGSPAERFADDILKEASYKFEDGKVTIWDAPGLGIVVDEEKLHKYTVSI